MASLRVEVVYALPAEADAVTVVLPDGATVAEAVRASGILNRHPEIDAARQRTGVHGRVVAAGTPLCDGDRVEIYRGLLQEPKDARRRRARQAARRR